MTLSFDVLLIYRFFILIIRAKEIQDYILHYLFYLTKGLEQKINLTSLACRIKVKLKLKKLPIFIGKRGFNCLTWTQPALFIGQISTTFYK